MLKLEEVRYVYKLLTKNHIELLPRLPRNNLRHEIKNPPSRPIQTLDSFFKKMKLTSDGGNSNSSEAGHSSDSTLVVPTQSRTLVYRLKMSLDMCHQKDTNSQKLNMGKTSDTVHSNGSMSLLGWSTTPT